MNNVCGVLIVYYDSRIKIHYTTILSFRGAQYVAIEGPGDLAVQAPAIDCLMSLCSETFINLIPLFGCHRALTCFRTQHWHAEPVRVDHKWAAIDAGEYVYACRCSK